MRSPAEVEPNPRVAGMLLDLARLAVGARPRRIGSRGDLPLPSIGRMARQHGLGPLVAGGLVRLGCRGREEEAGSAGAELRRLRDARDLAVAMDLEQGPLHLEVLAALSRARERGRVGAPPILLKGAHLRRTVYASTPHARMLNDLDLLVDLRDLEGVRAVLSELGYRPVPSPGPAFHRRLAHAEPWARHTRPGFVTLVDLHVLLVHRMRGSPAPADLRARAEPLPGEPLALGLGPVHLAVHLALHLGQEFFRGRMRSLVDLALHLDHLESSGTGSRLSDLGDDPVLRAGGRALWVALTLIEDLDPAPGHRLRARLRSAVDPGPAAARVAGSLFPPARVFDGRKAGTARPENLLRATWLIGAPGLRLAYPAYLGTVLATRGLLSFRGEIG